MCSLTLCIAVMFLSSQVPAAEPEAGLDPLFAAEEILRLTITAPITSIMKERPMEEYVPGMLQYTEADGSVVEFEIGVRTRGRFRRQVENCDFAPLRINFRKSETRGTLFDRQDKLKLVTHCEDSSPRYQQSVVSEYLAYRIFNLLSDVSFRTRLLEVTYIDTDRKNREKTSYAIFIEHADRLAKRVDLPRLKTNRLTVGRLDPEYAGLVNLFQYFVGNTDFSQIAAAPGEDCCHNHELLGYEDEPVFAVPYDFDMTGFVNAPHAQPSRQLDLRSVRQRLYRGRCVHNTHLPAATKKFSEQRSAIYALINSQEHLKTRTRRSRLSFVDKFYEDIGSEKKVADKLYDDCL